MQTKSYTATALAILFLIVLAALVGCSGTKTIGGSETAVATATDSTVAETSATTTEQQYVTDFTSGMVGKKDKATGTDATATDANNGEIKVKITATGDCALAPTQLSGYEESLHNYYDDYGEEYFMKNFKDLFSSDDFTLANMECALTDLPYYPEEQPDKAFFIVGKPAYARILSTASVEGCSLGNNHSMDVGIDGMHDTQKAIEDAGMLWAVDDTTATYVTDQGIKIGFVSAQLFGAYEDEEYIRNGINKLKEEGVDLIFACCHWGIETEFYPTDYQVNLAHEFVDMGADLIIGNHPHVVQGVEYYRGKVILYSLGNFCFGANKTPFDMKDMIYQQTFTFKDGELTTDLDATIIPVQISTDPNYNDYQPIILEGQEKADMIDRINTYCEPYGSVRLDGNGKISVDESDRVTDWETLPETEEPTVTEEPSDARMEESW